MPLRYDSEFFEVAGPALTQYAAAGAPALHDIETRRIRLKEVLKKKDHYVIPNGLERLIRHAPALDGHEVAIHHIRRKSRPDSGPYPAIIHIHGGGYFSSSAAQSTESLVEYVSKSGVQMFSIDYRLAPENRFPVPLEDCWSALTWIHSHAQSLNVDRRRIAIMGESAGGGLAANIALLARDRILSPPLAKQFLIYPMLDDRTRDDNTEGHAFFTVADNITGWTAYLGENVVGTEQVPRYAVAARNDNVVGLPELYMECPGLDILLPENLRYLDKFVAANIPTEFHLYDGLPHGFTSLAPSTSCSQRAIVNRVRAMSTF